MAVSGAKAVRLGANTIAVVGGQKLQPRACGVNQSQGQVQSESQRENQGEGSESQGEDCDSGVNSTRAVTMTTSASAPACNHDHVIDMRTGAVSRAPWGRRIGSGEGLSCASLVL